MPVTLVLRRALETDNYLLFDFNIGCEPHPQQGGALITFPEGTEVAAPASLPDGKTVVRYTTPLAYVDHVVSAEQEEWLVVEERPHPA